MACPDQATLDAIFPSERANAFFEALYGGAEDGAYDIKLVCERASATEAELAFNLIQRPGHCLKCSLTYGVPQVFERHPIINLKQVAKDVANVLGWTGVSIELGNTQEISSELHRVPMFLSRE